MQSKTSALILWVWIGCWSVGKNNISPERMEHKFLCMWWKRQNDECALHVLRRLSDSVSTPYAYNLFLQTERPVDTSSHSSTGLGLRATLNHSVHQRTTIKLMIQNQSCYHINKQTTSLIITKYAFKKTKNCEPKLEKKSD